MRRGPDGAYTVTGVVIERTSADPAGSGGRRIPVRIAVSRVDDRWLITSYDETGSPAPGTPDPSSDRDLAGGPANVVKAYYRAIAEGQYRSAYQFWESNGAASGKSFDEFRAGFSETAAVELIPGAPGRVEGAAGSQYLEIPVRVVARLRNGASQVFVGTYTLRRSVVDGAAPEQRAWHIYSAKLTSSK